MNKTADIGEKRAVTALAPDAERKAGRRLTAGVSASEAEERIHTLGLVFRLQHRFSVILSERRKR